jgi:hypothetical protein
VESAPAEGVVKPMAQTLISCLVLPSS